MLKIESNTILRPDKILNKLMNNYLEEKKNENMALVVY